MVNTNKKHSSGYFRKQRFKKVSYGLDRVGRFLHIPGCTVTPLQTYMDIYPGRFDDIGVNNLKSLHDRLFFGQDSDLTSPFLKLIPELEGYNVDNLSKTETRQIISEILDDITHSDETYNKFPELREFEEDQKKRLGNTSKIIPFLDESGLLSNVLGYFGSNPDLSKVNMEVLRESVNAVKSLVAEGSLEPVSLNQAFDQSDKTTNWGGPLWQKGRDLIPDTNQTYAQWSLLKAKEAVSNQILPNLPAVLVARIQPNGSNDPKQRGAFAISHIVTLIESTFQISLLAAMRKLAQFSELEETQSLTNEVATEMFQMSEEHDWPILCFDATGYDMSLCNLLLEEGYGCLKYWFRDGNEEMLGQLCNYMYSCDLITPIGVFSGREKALASGMSLTNAMGSIINLILFNYCVLMLGEEIGETTKSTANGDDALMFCKGLTPEVLKEILSPFGIVINPEKVMFKMNSASFCQRLYVRGYKINGINVGIRSLCRTIAGSVSYERNRPLGKWNSACDSVRCIMQLENLSTSPIFSRIVNLMIDADVRYGLGSSLTGGIYELFKIAAEGNDLAERLSDSSYDRGRIEGKLDSGSNLKTVGLINERTSNKGEILS